MKKRRAVGLFLEVLENRLTPATAITPTGQLWYSSNWSGYSLDTAPGQVQAVSAEWNVPAVTGSTTAYSSAWVGIDGDSSSTVEQIGTASEVHATKVGRNVVVTDVYYAWWEMYPANAMQPIKGLSVQAGDHIQANVSYVGDDPQTHYNLFTLSITDTTSNQSFSITTSLNKVVKRSSAEWIQEAPSSGGVLPLANFGSISFTNVQATFTNTSAGTVSGSIWDLAPYAQVYSGASSSINAIDMVTVQRRTTTVIAAVSPLNSAGDFQVIFGSTTPQAPDASSSTQAEANESLMIPTETGSLPRDVKLASFTMVDVSASRLSAPGGRQALATNSPLASLVGGMANDSLARPARSGAAELDAVFAATLPAGANWAGIDDGMNVASYLSGAASLGGMQSLPMMDLTRADETESLAEARGSIFAESCNRPDPTSNVPADVPGHFFDTAHNGLVASLVLAAMMLYGQNIVASREKDHADFDDLR